ncbi:vegetative cell wall protein gp1-like [Mizuhopecten yessoensis]|uniref:vegetative cell wall protein gp1-like n=1 Tax=Mizuhopecten yessoensis TaxID=6573 RepID=UPI000B4590C8|nr:vegetative cell wall protein gp1-like [Mizuhopecten yessoensis]
MESFQIQPQQIQSQQIQPPQQAFVDAQAASPGQPFGSRSGVNVPPSAHGSILDQALGVNPSQPIPKVNYGANANANSIIPNNGPAVVPIGQPQANPWAPSAWVDPIPGGPQSPGSAGPPAGSMPMQSQHSPFNPFGAQNPFQQPEVHAVPRQEFMQTPTKVAKAPGFRGRVQSTASVLQAGHQQMHAKAFVRPPPTTLPPVTKAANFWNQQVVTQQVPTTIVTQLTYRPTTFAPPVTKAPSMPSRWAAMGPQSMPPRQPTAPVTKLFKPAPSAKPKPKPRPKPKAKAKKAKSKRRQRKRYGFSKLLAGYGPRLNVAG